MRQRAKAELAPTRDDRLKVARGRANRMRHTLDLAITSKVDITEELAGIDAEIASMRAKLAAA